MSLTDIPITERALKLDDRSGSAETPNAKLLSRLHTLRGRWVGSTAQLVAAECCKFPLRIAAIVRRPSPREGVRLLPDSQGYIPESFCEQCSYLNACSEGIAWLSREYHWAGFSDRQIATAAFQLGAAWASDNARREDKDGVP
jgi:hypothetical protein